MLFLNFFDGGIFLIILTYRGKDTAKSFDGRRGGY